MQIPNRYHHSKKAQKAKLKPQAVRARKAAQKHPKRKLMPQALSGAFSSCVQYIFIPMAFNICTPEVIPTLDSGAFEINKNAATVAGYAAVGSGTALALGVGAAVAPAPVMGLTLPLVLAVLLLATIRHQGTLCCQDCSCC